MVSPLAVVTLPRQRQPVGDGTDDRACRVLARVRRSYGWSADAVAARAGLVVRKVDLRAVRDEIEALPEIRLPALPGVGGARLLAHLAEVTADCRTVLGERRADRLPGVGVLALPTTVQDYLVGRSRQAVRTNVRRARTDGCTVRPPRPVEVVGLEEVLLQKWDEGDGLRGFLTRADQVALVAVDATDEPLAVGVATVAGEWAHLDVLSSLGGPCPARYLLHTELVDRLCRLGVQHLAAENALALAPGVRYFQELLGYRPATLRIAGQQVPSGWC